jgi:uncharacterized protein YjeT (DUF2065 family)
MTEFLTAIGLMLIIEGALYALFPEGMKRAIAQMQMLSPQHLRMAGLTLAIVGFIVVALVSQQ